MTPPTFQATFYRPCRQPGIPILRQTPPFPDFLNLTPTPTHIPNQSFVKKFFGLFFVFGFF
jgi:hypothetical protein